MQKFFNTIFGRIKSVDWLNVPTPVYVRYIIAIIAALNTLLNIFGINPINLDQNALYDGISALIMILVLAVNTYKDNPTSPEALESNKYLQMLRDKNDNTTNTPDA